jgi:hypothetical protein
MQLTINEIIYIVLGVCVLFYLTMFLLLKRHNDKNKIDTNINKSKDKPEKVVVTKTKEKPIVNNSNEILLKRNFKYVVGDNNKIKPGKYILITTVNEITEFNIKRNGYVKNYANDSTVILSEGDDLTATNISVILSK